MYSGYSDDDRAREDGASRDATPEAGGTYQSWRDAGWQDAAESDAQIDLEGQADFESTAFRPAPPMRAQHSAGAGHGAHAAGGSHAATGAGGSVDPAAPTPSSASIQHVDPAAVPVVIPTSSTHRTYAAGASSSAAGAPEGQPYENETVPLRPVPNVGKSEKLIRVRKKHKKHRVRNAIIGVFVVLFVLLGVAAGALALYVNSLNEALGFSDEEELSSLMDVLYVADESSTADDDEDDSDAFYILILGSDARETDTSSRSDVIMLVRVDPTEGTIHLVSIPRDTRIYLSGYGYVKINAAYAYGGAALAVSAVSAFAGVEISHYVEIHFEEFETLVDMMGGVWVDVPVSNTQTGVTNTGVTILAGMQLMDGETALAFARERYGYNAGDYQRTENQRILVTALINQLLDLSPLELPSVIMQLCTCVTTDYSVTDILQLALAFQNVDDLTIYSAVTPSSTATISGVSYVIADEDAWAAMMALVDAGEDPNS